jgi:hypothetical protein
MSTKWIIVLIITVVALAAAIGLVVFMRPFWRHTVDSRPPEFVALLAVEENKEPVKVESGIEGHRDLPFRNRVDRPVSIRLEATDCDCAKVLIGVAPESCHELDAAELRKRATDSALAWQAVEKGGESFTLPPRAVGLLRMKWKTKGEGDHLFWASFWVEDGQSRGHQRVEVPTHFIEPVRVRVDGQFEKREIDVGTLKAGEERTVPFLCCSPTRDKFTLTSAPPRDDPFVTYGKPQPLTPEELQTLAEKTGAAVRAGYRVSVTVREKADDSRLDMGPFRRRIDWTTDIFPGHEVSTYVNGTVQGEVTLADSKGRTFIDLGTASAEALKPVTFTLESRDPQLRLAVDEEKTLDFLTVELLDGKEGKAAKAGKTWRVRIAFRTDSLFRGKFPNPDRRGYDSPGVCSAVFVVSRQGSAASPVRRLFVPVRGNVRPF